MWNLILFGTGITFSILAFVCFSFIKSSNSASALASIKHMHMLLELELCREGTNSLVILLVLFSLNDLYDYEIYIYYVVLVFMLQV